jgi:UDP-2,3-diacylglucosamine pyrophosphatase LpxH
MLGDAAYIAMMKLNTLVNNLRARWGLPYWSLSKHAKHKVKNAVEFISRFETAVAKAAADRGLDGVVCGHIHTAEARRFGDVTYYNDGDWVEGCTALVEHFNGEMEILHWAAIVDARERTASAIAA